MGTARLWRVRGGSNKAARVVTGHIAWKVQTPPLAASKDRCGKKKASTPPNAWNGGKGVAAQAEFRGGAPSARFEKTLGWINGPSSLIWDIARKRMSS